MILMLIESLDFFTQSIQKTVKEVLYLFQFRVRNKSKQKVVSYVEKKGECELQAGSEKWSF